MIHTGQKELIALLEGSNTTDVQQEEIAFASATMQMPEELQHADEQKRLEAVRNLQQRLRENREQVRSEAVQILDSKKLEVIGPSTRSPNTRGFTDTPWKDPK